MQVNKKNTYLILSNIARGVIDNSANALLERVPRHRGLAHKQLTRAMFFSTRGADLNRVGPLLQLLARLPRLLGFFRHCLKTRRQEKRPQGVTANKRLRKDRHGKYKLFVGRI